MNTWLATWPWLYPALLHLQRTARYVSVAIDVPLLLTGASLWALLGHHPLQQTWLSAKLVLLVVYIVLGSFALKRGRTRGQRLAFFIAALAVVLTMAGMARSRHAVFWV